MTRHCRYSVVRFSITATVAAAFALAACGTPASAQDAPSYGNSLDWVPADVGVYSASLRLKEQIDIVAGSNAWKKFRAIPAVAQVWAMAEAQINNPEGPAAMFWQMMALPENKQLIQLLREMGSEEIVFYAGEDITNLVELYQVLNASRIAPLAAALESGSFESAESEAESMELQAELVAEAIQENPAILDVPELVLGFRIKDRKAGTTQLARLEVIANMLLDQSPLGAKFERRTLGETEYLVLYLDGSMIPWPATLPEGSPWSDKTYQEIKGIASKKTLYLAIGVWQDYLLVSVSSKTDHLSNLGDGDAVGGREELATLREHRDRKLVGVSYISRDVVESQMIHAEDLNELAQQFGEMIEDADAIPAAMRPRLEADFKDLADDFDKYLPTPGAAAAYQFLTDSGFESYSYNWSKNATLDAEKALPIAEHLGGSPILAVAARGVDDPEAYDLLVKWIEKGFGYFQEFGLPKMDEDDRAEAERAIEVARPLVARLDTVTREKLIPALSDSQSALVLDADIASKQWHREMPTAYAPLPMAELAVVVGVSDADALLAAMSEYREIINDVIEADRREHPGNVPDSVELRAPEERKVSGGTLYVWELDDQLRLDPQIAPCGAIGEDFAAFATSPALAERVLAEHELDAHDALSDADEERAMVVAFDWAGLVSAVEPWIIYSLRAEMAGEEAIANDPASDPQSLREIRSQVESGLQILKCFRGVWAETQHDGEAWVTHSTAVFEDLPD